MIITPEQFKFIVHGEPINAEARETRQCLDDYIGASFETAKPLNLCDRQEVLIRPDRPCVVLILESPHIAEYPNDGGKIGPALGRTGCLICGHLGAILRARLCDRPRNCQGLLLINAIQYQCSLGIRAKKGGEMRDRVFAEVWRKGGRADFIERLRQTIAHEEDLVINACTIGRGKTPLCSLVEDAIREARNDCPSDLRLYHPCNWYRKDRRASKLL